MSDQITCPGCHLSDQVTKVSTLYLQKQVKNWRKLAPPSGGKANNFRPLHPDLLVIGFSLVLPVFVYGILNQQPALFVPILVLLVGAYTLYLIFRRSLVAKFEADQQSQKDEKKRVEKAIGAWMKLYFCAREEGVFIPGGGEVIPVDQMPGYLMTAGSAQKRP